MTASLHRNSEADSSTSTNSSFNQTRSFNQTASFDQTTSFPTKSNNNNESNAGLKSRPDSDGLSSSRNESNYDQENNCRISPERSGSPLELTGRTRSSANYKEPDAHSETDEDNSIFEVRLLV